MKEENKTIIAYKGFNKNLRCRGFQYEVGKEYELPKGEKPEVCSNGFHACKSPLEVLIYYFLDGDANLSRFCEVEQSGEFSKEEDSTKVASSKIKIKAEITFTDLIKLGIEWLKEKISSAQIASSGKFAQIASAGDYEQIASSGKYAKIGSSSYYAEIGSSDNSAQIGSSGDFALIASSGNFAHIGSSGDDARIGSSGEDAKIGSSGNSAQIGSSGDYAQIASSGKYAKIGSSGDFAKICSSSYYAEIGSSGNSARIGSSGNNAKISSSGEDAVIMCAGHNSRVKAKEGSWITLAEWYEYNSFENMRPKCVKTEYVDGKRIKADTWYKLVDGEFVEVDN